MKILVTNVGSTSLKFKLFFMENGKEDILLQGGMERIGQGGGAYKWKSASGANDEGEKDLAGYKEAIALLLDILAQNGLHDLSGLGGIAFKVVQAKGISGCVRLNDEVLTAMQEYSSVAGAHNPAYILAIRTFAEIVPDVPLVGLFETAFHSEIQPYVYTYGLPYDLAQKHGLRRYGFHGASHRYVSERILDLLKKRPLKHISCHLGGSSSICALIDSVSLDTSMGFSPQSGQMQSSRVGDVDVFAVLYAMEKEGWDIEQARQVLLKDSGLKGVSGTSGDFRDMFKASDEGQARSTLALDAYFYETRKYIGAYTASLEGVDVLTFAGGIGENEARARKAVCERFKYLGLKLDREKNEQCKSTEQPIHAEDSKVQVWVVPTNEEIVVARETRKILKG